MTAPKSIFITGAARGIGAETARLFLAKGWHVGASDVNADALAAFGREAGSERLSIHPADVRDFGAIEFALGDFARSTGGRLDAVFANAGVLFMGPDERITRSQKDLLVDVNVRGVIHTIDAAFPYLVRTPGARVVAMSSTSAEYGSPEHALYSATKFFVRGLTEALDIEYRAHGIRVAGIYVPYVQTGMVFDAPVKPASIERLGVKIPPRRVAETVWRAVNGRHRVHWRVGLDAKLINAAVRLLGGCVAPIYARMMRG
jgi:NAD(P)-dependent dehydrogenase (short-subunit alcohol dehydrogenase family)